ncbi:hypothetical protein Tco_1100319 [Tanacetum coccineum]
MEWKSFEEGLAEITETLKRLQYTLLFHQAKLKESFRQARQDFSLVRQDISLATERSIKAAIKEEVDHEEQFDFLGVQLNQRIPNRTVKARKVKARESCGLGFDTDTNTWKMVCVLLKEYAPPYKPDLVKKNLCSMVHVFGTNSWREIPQVPSYPISREAVFVNGCLHWLSS